MIGLCQALAQLVDHRLGQQSQGHLAQSNMEVEGAGAFPAQVLIKTVELLDVPTISKVGGQGWHFRSCRGAAKALKVIIFGPFARALNIAKAGLVAAAAAWMEAFSGDSKTGPVTKEGFWAQSSIMLLQNFGLTQRSQQIKRGRISDIIEQFDGEMLDVGHEQGPGPVLGLRQDLLSQFEHFLGSRG